MVMAELKVLKPEWESVPYQVKRTAVRDACRAMSNVKTFNLELKDSQTHGQRADETFAQLGYRSRKNPKQSCYIPDDAVTEHGVYHTMLGPLRMAEAIPAEHKECRLVQESGRYWLIVPYPAQCDIETPSGDGVVALDPGVRTFLTYFSETDCGKLGHHAFGRIQRLCHWLDDLISRTAKAPNRRKRRQMRAAQARMRQRIANLVDELHWQLARWLTSNYRIILLPTFETQDMTQRAGRRIRSKTARMMLTFRHYEFKQRLKWKAWQRGALVLDVDEAYTSKTRSWDGTVNTKLGGAKVIRDETGFGIDRDVNGARGIFLRALGDSPFPAWLAHAGCIANNGLSVERCSAFNCRIINLVDELHWQTARWLTGNYKVILLPTFETQDMAGRAGRRIRSKTARNDAEFPPLRVQATPAVEGLAAWGLSARCQ